ncbi:MAG: DUF4212 domain-containing protein [Hyphomicrobiaceae bacterium]
MVERGQRKPYWRQTKWQLLTTLLPLIAATIAIPLYAGELNAFSFLGFPLGYFLTGHGLLIVALLASGNFVSAQNTIDRWYGANEDA